MGRIYWIKVDGTEEDIEADISDAKANDDFLKVIKKAEERYKTGFAEMVWVLHNGQRTLMLVDEFGAQPVMEGYPLPVNEKATELYRAASRARGQDWTGPPYIHGDVVIFENIRMR